jgi:hypothetical protein
VQSEGIRLEDILEFERISVAAVACDAKNAG